MLTVPESLVREVKKKLSPGAKLFLCATHTHSAPDSQMLNERMTLSIPGIAKFDSKWLDWYSTRIAQTVTQSMRSIAPLHDAKVQFERVSLNRARRKLANPMNLATLVQFGDFRLLHYAAHATIHGDEQLQTSGDWPGSVVQNKFAHMVLPGAIGDVSPASEGTNASAQLAHFAQTLRSEFGSSIPTHRQNLNLHQISWTEVPIALDPVIASPAFSSHFRVPEALARLAVNQFAPKEGVVSAIRIGKLAIVGIPGEPTSEIGVTIREVGRRMGFEFVLPVSHVNGWIGYILTPEDLNRGGYEAALNFHGPQTSAKVISAATKALEALARQDFATASVGLGRGVSASR